MPSFVNENSASSTLSMRPRISIFFLRLARVTLLRKCSCSVHGEAAWLGNLTGSTRVCCCGLSSPSCLVWNSPLSEIAPKLLFYKQPKKTNTCHVFRGYAIPLRKVHVVWHDEDVILMSYIWKALILNMPATIGFTCAQSWPHELLTGYHIADHSLPSTS